MFESNTFVSVAAPHRQTVARTSVSLIEEKRTERNVSNNHRSAVIVGREGIAKVKVPNSNWQLPR